MHGLRIKLRHIRSTEICLCECACVGIKVAPIPWLMWGAVFADCVVFLFFYYKCTEMCVRAYVHVCVQEGVRVYHECLTQHHSMNRRLHKGGWCSFSHLNWTWLFTYLDPAQTPAPQAHLFQPQTLSSHSTQRHPPTCTHKQVQVRSRSAMAHIVLKRSNFRQGKHFQKPIASILGHPVSEFCCKPVLLLI